MSTKLITKRPGKPLDATGMIRAFKSEIEARINKKFEKFFIPCFSALLDEIGGRVYYLKVHIGDDTQMEYIEVRVHEKADGTYDLDEVKGFNDNKK